MSEENEETSPLPPPFGFEVIGEHKTAVPEGFIDPNKIDIEMDETPQEEPKTEEQPVEEPTNKRVRADEDCPDSSRVVLLQKNVKDRDEALRTSEMFRATSSRGFRESVSKVVICARVRPVLESEKEKSVSVSCNVDNNSFTAMCSSGKEKKEQTVSCWKVWGEDVTQRDVSDAVSTWTDGVVDGYSSVVLFIGEETSGKSYSMLGESLGKAVSLEDCNAHMGVVPFVLKRLLSMKSAMEIMGKSVSVSVESFYVKNDNSGKTVDVLGGGKECDIIEGTFANCKDVAEITRRELLDETSAIVALKELDAGISGTLETCSKMPLVVRVRFDESNIDFVCVPACEEIQTTLKKPLSDELHCFLHQKPFPPKDLSPLQQIIHETMGPRSNVLLFTCLSPVVAPEQAIKTVSFIKTVQEGKFVLVKPVPPGPNPTAAKTPSSSARANVGHSSASSRIPGTKPALPPPPSSSSARVTTTTKKVTIGTHTAAQSSRATYNKPIPHREDRAAPDAKPLPPKKDIYARELTPTKTKVSASARADFYKPVEHRKDRADDLPKDMPSKTGPARNMSSRVGFGGTVASKTEEKGKEWPPRGVKRPSSGSFGDRQFKTQTTSTDSKKLEQKKYVNPSVKQKPVPHWR